MTCCLVSNVLTDCTSQGKEKLTIHACLPIKRNFNEEQKSLDTVMKMSKTILAFSDHCFGFGSLNVHFWFIPVKNVEKQCWHEALINGSLNASKLASFILKPNKIKQMSFLYSVQFQFYFYSTSSQQLSQST